jgi:hypothetical protein
MVLHSKMVSRVRCCLVDGSVRLGGEMGECIRLSYLDYLHG